MDVALLEKANVLSEQQNELQNKIELKSHQRQLLRIFSASCSSSLKLVGLTNRRGEKTIQKSFTHGPKIMKNQQAEI